MLMQNKPKLSLLFPTFDGTQSVSGYRGDAFFQALKNNHDTCCISTNLMPTFNSWIVTFWACFFSTRFYTDIEDTADTFIVSAPQFTTFILGYFLKIRGKTVIFDLRDHVDMTYEDSTRGNTSGIQRLKRLCFYYTQKFLLNFFVGNSPLLCAGFMSSSHASKDFDTDNIYPIPNGPVMSSEQAVLPDLNATLTPKTDTIRLLCVGSLYNFRHTPKIKQILNSFANDTNCDIVIDHYGSSTPDFQRDFSSIDRLTYNQMDRQTHSKIFSKIDDYWGMILFTSDQLPWEPTTSVFDCVSHNKPVIYCGSMVNEAYSLLFMSGLPIYNELGWINQVNLTFCSYRQLIDRTRYNNLLNLVLTRFHKNKNK